MNLKRQLFAMCTAAMLCGPVFANNDVVYSYAGAVDSDDTNRGWVSFTGQFAFNKTSTDQIPDSVTADYKIAGWPYGMNVVFKDAGNHVTDFSLNDSFDILVANNLPGLGNSDQFGTLARNAALTDSLGFTLADLTQTAFASDALPLQAGGLTLGMFDWSQFRYESGAGTVIGHLTSLSCVSGCDGAVPAPVPEPQTYALMLAGLGVVGFVGRRRREV